MDLELPPEARALLDAVVAIGSELDLRGVLSRIVEASCDLTDAEYGVLGILDDDLAFVDLVPHGLTKAQVEEIGMMPKGHGLLGLVPRERRSIRVDHVAEHPEADGDFPVSHPTIDRFLGAPVLLGDQAFGHLYLGNKRGGSEFTATDQALVEALARAAGMMIDNARSYEQAEWRRQWLASTARIGADLSGTAGVQEAIDELMASLVGMCGARLTAFVLRDGDLLEIRQVAGEGEGAVDVVEALRAQIHRVVDSGTPTRLPVGAGRVTLVVPVRTRLVGSGAVVVDHARETPSLRGLMLDLVTVTADQVGLILDRDQAVRDRARLLVAKDRDRIARDLHDLVIQRLFATGMQLQAARSLDTADLRRRADAAVAELDAAIKELRAAIFELGTGTGRPLLEETRALLSEYADVLGFQPVLRVIGPVDRALVPEACNQLLTALREALSNVARHAQASSVSVELTASSAWFRLRVTDDGRGFDAATVRRGSGSTNLRTRAEDLGGHLSVTSAPGVGTSLEWVIPAVG
ncbi:MULTISPECIES: GAF domain-containing sensor histidine kinase [Nocardioides]|uniref:GAF domain-containing sensor histidine kinase n=1 Tax=Nocardioides vastitatis TaxID=2568655 RepID=A0ABW0ZKR8_9ACTN|nr:GAF domain-containing sensor histidine kinase [Nocardioides sp.]THJ06486.1 GAF domain-containing sensor histidine kinase [Nocardioides sp.]